MSKICNLYAHLCLHEIYILNYWFTGLNMYCTLFTQDLTPAEPDDFFTLMSNSQRGRMDEQRCSLNVSPKSTPTHKPSQNTSLKG